MHLTFLGATQTVTGSKYLLSIDSKNILIDCGLFQGYKELRLRNWENLPIDPHKIDAVVLTHAHIDHSGYIPLLIKNGYKGKIYCTPATKDLCNILLPDSGYLQEEAAAHANKYGYSKHHPALPLYTKNEAVAALKQFSTVEFNKLFTPFNNIHIRFRHAGHILGAAFLQISAQGKQIVFSGDLGRPHDIVMNAPEIQDTADYLILESTYGDRRHDQTNPITQLTHIFQETIHQGGTLIIPAFAVGRAQTLLYLIEQMKEKSLIARETPVFLDSPMAINASHLLSGYLNEIRLTKDECINMGKVAQYIVTPEESKMIAHLDYPSIIISASGMATGGRVLHHLKNFLPDPKSTILFTGFQAGGTRGDRILRGEQEIKMFGEMIPVRARIECLHNLSAHADYQEILEWLHHFTHKPKKVFITHGEKNSANALMEKISSELSWECMIPQYCDTVELL